MERQELKELALEAYRRHDEARQAWKQALDADTEFLLAATGALHPERVVEAKLKSIAARDRAEAAHTIAREALGRLTGRLNI